LPVWHVLANRMISEVGPLWPSPGLFLRPSDGRMPTPLFDRLDVGCRTPFSGLPLLGGSGNRREGGKCVQREHWGRIFDLDFRLRVSHHLATLKLAPAFKSAH
jgi:hypothetical protein